MNNYSPEFIRKKTANICLVVMLFSLIPFLLFKVSSLLLLLFGSILFAIFFHGIADILSRFTKLNSKLCLVFSIIIVIAFWVVIFNLIGSTINVQYSRLAQLLPKTVDNLQTMLGKYSWGTYITDSIESMGDGVENIFTHLPKFFNSTFGFLGDVYALLFLGVFLMLAPGEYFVGIISLFPDKRKKDAVEIGQKLLEQLTTWLKVQVLDMLFVFTLTAIGLLILGIDLWLILACLAGLLTFIPNLGPTLALIPAALVGLMDGPMTALYIIGIFLLVQLIESAVFAPLVQKRMLSLPPAMVLFFQLLLSSFGGPLALLFATPILVVIVNLVNEIYVKRILKQDTAGVIMEQLAEE